MSESSSMETSLRGLSAWSKTGMVKPRKTGIPLSGWTSSLMIQDAPQSNPANSEALNSTANEDQERSNDLSALREEQVSTVCTIDGGLSQKQKPAGKPRD